jgi:hypothetical protein
VHAYLLQRLAFPCARASHCNRSLSERPWSVMWRRGKRP